VSCASSSQLVYKSISNETSELLCDSCERPYLDKRYSGAVRELTCGSVMQKPDSIDRKIAPLVSRINGMIDWYCFLVHDRTSGVPTTPDDRGAYFHIRVSLRSNVDSEEFLKSLPGYCLMTRKVEREWVKDISAGGGTMFDTSLLKNGEIEDVWRIIGEQSEWLLDMLSIYRDDAQIPLRHIGQWFHYYFNMTQLSISCPRC
jgi:hypothetical protein